MDQPDTQQPPVISERVIVNGIVTQAALFADGRLWWSDTVQSCLNVEKDVIGFVCDGPRIRVKTVVESRNGLCCVDNKGKLVRKDVLFQPLSEESQRLWCQKLREYVDSLGKYCWVLLWFFERCYQDWLVIVRN